MKSLLKGFFLGTSLIIAHKLCGYTFSGFDYDGIAFPSAIVFFLITTAFLVSKNISNLLICGFCGLFVMFFGEIFVASAIFRHPLYFIEIYLGGFWGSMAALLVSTILTAGQIKLSDLFFKEDKTMAKNLKIKLMLYAVISAIGFSYLVLPEKAGISVVIFALIQLACLYFIVPDRKRLVLFIPIFVMSLNCFISASTIWRISNVIVSAVLYSCMFMPFNFKTDSLSYFTAALERIVAPFMHFALPFKWVLELNSEKAPVIKRIGIALIVALPCAALLTLVLANADMVFSMKTENLLSDIFYSMNFHTIFLIICGIIAGLYLFGTMYCAHIDVKHKEITPLAIKGDLIIINILLFAILFVYTLFVIIQFKYLFAGSTLPEGLTYTDYARKGFFELLALTGVNIAIILTVIKFTKSHDGKWQIFTKILCHYLCAVTIVLLVSSFYRMYLYTNDDGLTRLRFFVMGFLVFEAIGLLITFLYIAKPKFNITLIYIVIALTYYTLLNVIPADNIIARNQIDKYLAGEREGLEYIFTLSADAAPAMDYLYMNTTDEVLKQNVDSFLEWRTDWGIPDRWQRYDISTARAEEIMQMY